MTFFPPILLIRKNRIIKKLKECNAFSEHSAVTLQEAGIFHPNTFPKITQKLVKDNIIKVVNENKYYLNK